MLLTAAAAGQFTVSDAAVVEGNSGTPHAVFTVSLTTASASTTSVTVATSNGSAVAGTDYTAVAPTVETFTAGQTSKNVSVAIIPNTVQQAARTFSLSLSAPSGATVFRTTGTGVILDDDLIPAVSVLDGVILRPTSGNATLKFNVSLSSASPNTVTVPFNTSNGSAVATVHYTSASGTLTFTPGQLSQNVSVTILPNAANDVDRSFTLSLGTATNAFVPTTSAVGLILNSVTPSQIQVRSAGAFTCSKKIVFTVTLDHPSAVAVGVTYNTVDGTRRPASITPRRSEP